MVALAQAFGRFRPRKALVAGDLLLDAYTMGRAARISPEAPVPVVHVTHEETRPGGAGNVMLNLLSLGLDVVAVGRVGDDDSGKTLLAELRDEGIDVRGIVVDSACPTPVKKRIIAQNQQLIRIDHETIVPLAAEAEAAAIALLPQLLDGVDVVAVSDYAKGTLSTKLLQALIAEARERSIPVLVDPKGTDYSKYAGATVVKPNLKEALAVSGCEEGTDLDVVADRVVSALDIGALMVTRSEEGISIWQRTTGALERSDFPVRVREVKDVTGAGDTVLAVIACALGNGVDLGDASQLANIAAGIAVERVGCARVTLQELARRVLRDHSETRVFDREHLFPVQEALRGRSSHLFALDTRNGFDPELYGRIRSAKESSEDVVIALRDDAPDNQVVDLLASLHEVTCILSADQSLDEITAWLRPTHTEDLSVTPV